jgi:hypothetical protein
MTVRAYEVTVSAVLARASAQASLTEWVQMATRAKAQVDAILGAPVKAPAGGAGKSAAKKEADERISEAERASKELERIRQKENDAIIRDVDRIAKAEERAADRKVAASKKATDAQRKAVVSESFSTLRRTTGAAVRIGGEIVGGFGIDTSLGGGIRRSVERDRLARDISAQAFRGRPGETPEDPAALERLAQSVGEKYRIDPNKVLGGLGKFQALTGDLDTGKAALGGLSALAKAFNVDLDQMVGSAGQLSSALGDVGEGKAFATSAEKAEELLRLMKASTAQTQEGAIEMSDLVSQYAKLKGAGIRFEGNTGDNILKMSAMAQMAYQTGGAGSVSQASNSVMAFTNTLSTAARRRAFKKYDVDIDSKEAGKFVNPYDIIKQSLEKTGGDTDKMKEMWANVLGEKAVNALSAKYRGAGGGKGGLAAVDAEFQKFGGTVSDDQLRTNLATQMGSKASAAQDFQNEMDKATGQLATDLLPTLRELAPIAKDAASGLAWIVKEAAAHPVAAIVMAIAGSIGKAAIGEMAGKALVGALANAGGGRLAIGTIAAATIATAYMSIKEYNEEKKKGAGEEREKLESNEDLVKRVRDQFAAGKFDPEALNELARRRADVEGARGRASRYDANDDLGMFGKIGLAGSAVTDLFTGDTTSKDIGAYEGAAAQNATDKGALDRQAESMDAILKAVSDARKNPTADDIGAAVARNIAPLMRGGPTADQSGRVPQ